MAIALCFLLICSIAPFVVGTLFGPVPRGTVVHGQSTWVLARGSVHRRAKARGLVPRNPAARNSTRRLGRCLLPTGLTCKLLLAATDRMIGAAVGDVRVVVTVGAAIVTIGVAVGVPETAAFAVGDDERETAVGLHHDVILRKC